MATAQPLPTDHAIVHHLLQNYVLDDGSMTDNPIGLASKQLTAHFHQVHGLATRLQTTIRCVKELSIDVKNYALSSYATAQAVLSRNQKQQGAIVINLGGGISDYIAYQKGAVVHTGVLGVGGDHLTNDIVSGLKIPYAKAELLKKTEGSVILDSRRRSTRASSCRVRIILRNGSSIAPRSTPSCRRGRRKFSRSSWRICRARRSGLTLRARSTSPEAHRR